MSKKRLLLLLLLVVSALVVSRKKAWLVEESSALCLFGVKVNGIVVGDIGDLWAELCLFLLDMQEVEGEDEDEDDVGDADPCEPYFRCVLAS